MIAHVDTLPDKSTQMNVFDMWSSIVLFGNPETTAPLLLGWTDTCPPVLLMIVKFVPAGQPSGNVSEPDVWYTTEPD